MYRNFTHTTACHLHLVQPEPEGTGPMSQQSHSQPMSSHRSTMQFTPSLRFLLGRRLLVQFKDSDRSWVRIEKQAI